MLNRAQTTIRPDPAVTALVAAVKAQQAGRLAEAIADYKAALRLRPGFLPAHFQLGQLYVQTNRITDAIFEYETVVRATSGLDPNLRNAAYLRLGLLYIKLGRSEEGKAEFHRLLQLDPHNKDALYELGVLEATEGHTAAAIPYLQAYTRLVPGSALVHYNLGILLARSGNATAAAKELRAALASGRDLPATIRSSAWFDLGVIEDQQHNLAAAAAAYGHAADIDPHNIRAWISRALDDQKLGHDAEALRAYGKVLQLSPTDETALFNRGVLFLQSHQWTEAAASFQAVLKTHPENAAARSNLAYAYLSLPEAQRKAHLKEAAALYARAEAEDPKNVSNYTGLAFVYEASGHPKAAAAQYEKAAALKPGNLDLLGRVASLYEEAAQKDHTSWPLAVAGARQVANARPADPAGWMLLSEYQKEAGDEKAAEETLRSYLKQHPGNALVALQLASLIAIRPAESAEARSLYSTVLAHDPGNVAALQGRAALERITDPNAAAADLAAALPHASGFSAISIGSQLVDLYRQMRRPADITTTYQEMIRKASQPAPVSAGVPGASFDLSGYLPSLRRSLAQSYEQQRQFVQAAAIYRQLYAENPKDAESLESAARDLQQAGKPAEALSLFAEVVDRFPSDFLAAAEYLRLSLAQKGPDATGADLTRLIRAHANDPDADRTLDAFRIAAQQASALPWLETIYTRLAEEPGMGSVRTALARLYSSTGKWQQAEDLYTKLIAANPQSAEYPAGRGQVEETHAQTPAALEDYQAAVKLAPDNAEYLISLARVLRQLPGHDSEEIDALQHLLDLRPTDILTARRLANLYSGPDKEKQRIDLYRKLITRAPNLAEYHNALASDLEATGDVAGATTEYQTAHTLDPQDPVSRTALIRLGRLTPTAPTQAPGAAAGPGPTNSPKPGAVGSLSTPGSTTPPANPPGPH